MSQQQFACLRGPRVTVSILPSCILEKVTLNKTYLDDDEDDDVGKRGRRRSRRNSAAFAGSRFAGACGDEYIDGGLLSNMWPL